MFVFLIDVNDDMNAYASCSCYGCLCLSFLLTVLMI